MSAPKDRQLRLRYAGRCRICTTVLEARSTAVYEPAMRTVRCLSCVPGPAATAEVPSAPDGAHALAFQKPLVGTAGSSARREYERRRLRREDRVRTAHPKLTGLLLALSSDPWSTTSWAVGASGEERLGAQLDKVAGDVVRVLHDRRIPGTRANIDHVVVSAAGVFVIDAKKYKGRPRLKVEGGLFSPRVDKLLIGSRDQSHLVEGVGKQVEVVTRVFAGADSAPVHGVLCFVQADWPLFGGAFQVGGVHVLWPRKLVHLVKAKGRLSVDAIERLHRTLAERLPYG